MDLALYHYLNSLDFSRHARCPRCGQNSLSGSDGFMVSACMNCEGYHCHSQFENPLHDGVAKRLFGWFVAKCQTLVSTFFQNEKNICRTKGDVATG